jgi:hypothetical protein
LELLVEQLDARFDDFAPRIDSGIEIAQNADRRTAGASPHRARTALPRALGCCNQFRIGFRSAASLRSRYLRLLTGGRRRLSAL